MKHREKIRNVRRHGWVAAGLILAAGAVFWGVNLVQLKDQVSRYTDYWQQRSRSDGDIIYVALGDSAAQGIGASRPEAGYVGLLARQIERESGRHVKIINLSRSGAKVRDVTQTQLPQLPALRPDIVTLDIGGNDIRRYRSERFSADINALVSQLPAGTIIADVPYFMHGRWERDAAQAAAQLRAAAKARALTVAPLHQTMEHRGYQAMFTDYAADGFHPNDSGYRVWASAFSSAISARVSATRATP